MLVVYCTFFAVKCQVKLWWNDFSNITVCFQTKYIAQSFLWHAGSTKKEGTKNKCTLKELSAATSRVLRKTRRIRRLFIHDPCMVSPNTTNLWWRKSFEKERERWKRYRLTSNHQAWCRDNMTRSIIVVNAAT